MARICRVPRLTGMGGAASRARDALGRSILVILAVATCCQADPRQVRPGRFELGIRLGGYGISSATPYSYYTGHSAPSVVGLLGIRLVGPFWTQVRLQRFSTPVRAILTLRSDPVEVGMLRATLLEVVPIVFGARIGERWDGSILPWSYARSTFSTSVKPDLYYYPGSDIYTYAVEGLVAAEHNGMGICGASLHYGVSSHVRLGVETWVARILTPKAGLEIYELGRRETNELRGLSVVLPIWIGVDLRF